MTTFETPFGRYRWLRLPFGISPAPESTRHQALEGLKGVACIADDILIAGAGETEAEATVDHNRNLDRCREKGLKLNRKKRPPRSKEGLCYTKHATAVRSSGRTAFTGHGDLPGKILPALQQYHRADS